jgi:hypothetical protein
MRQWLLRAWFKLGFGDAVPVVDPRPDGAAGGTVSRFVLRYNFLGRLRLLVSGRTRVCVVVFTEQQDVTVVADRITFNVLPPGAE